MKKFLSILIFLLMLTNVVTAENLDAAALHSSDVREGSLYAGNEYLFDTLTLAGSGFDGVQQFTVAALEALAVDETLSLGYENTFSLMTSGGVFTNSVFTGIKLYDFLLYAGLKADLPDDTPVKMISKDGYTLYYTLGQMRALYNSYENKGDQQAVDSALPVIVAFGTEGLPLVGPTGTQPVTMRFNEEHGYDETADNVGGPLRMVMGMISSREFNAPNCAKWLAAVVVGDAGDYVFSREVTGTEMPEIAQDGDWTHGNQYPDWTLTITGSEAVETVLSLAEFESLREGVERAYCAASSGCYAYEGVMLKYIVEKYLAEGLEAPSQITVVSADGYKTTLGVDAVMAGVDSLYRPGEHSDMLLAYAINGAPMVYDIASEGYNGENAFGPVRLVVENTISAWVKNVAVIILGEEIVK